MIKICQLIKAYRKTNTFQIHLEFKFVYTPSEKTGGL